MEPLRIGLFDMVMAFSRAMDLLHSAISEHHLRTAYVAACVAEEAGWPPESVLDMAAAGAMHDVAAVCSPASRSLIDQALVNHLGQSEEDVHAHAAEGHALLGGFAPFASAAEAIRFHHVEWRHGEGRFHRNAPVPLSAHLLHLADHVAVLPHAGLPAVMQARDIRQEVSRECGSRFHPEFVAHFEAVSTREAFWLDLTSRHKERLLRERFQRSEAALHMDELNDLARVFARIVDYRSSYTAAHSSDVARVCTSLAAGMGLEQDRVRLVGIAGYLHDIGKLAVPPPVLEKPGRLDDAEILLIRQHPYFTHQILSAVPGLGEVCIWAAYHHERIDGRGYPFRPARLPLEARIVAVADIFTAITEDRPYRAGMTKQQSLAVLAGMVAEGAIDGDVVSRLARDYEALQFARLQRALSHAA